MADYLRDHAKVAKVHYLAHHEEASVDGRLFARQCTRAGSTFSFDIVGGQAAAFKFPNALQIFKLAVSLGDPTSTDASPTLQGRQFPPSSASELEGVAEYVVNQLLSLSSSWSWLLF